MEPRYNRVGILDLFFTVEYDVSCGFLDSVGDVLSSSALLYHLTARGQIVPEYFLACVCQFGW